MFEVYGLDDIKSAEIDFAQPKYVDFLNESAKNGDITAHYYLGIYYEEIEQDDLKAFEHFKIAAEGEMQEAQIMLYLFYYWGGDGISIDKEKAFKWIKKAADQGDSKAQYYLGRMYLDGQGTEQDLKKAFDLFVLSAENGNAMAAYDLGVMYQNGEYVEPDYEKGIEWIEKSAKMGMPEAQYSIGLHYLSLEDFNKALDYFYKAAKQGNQSAKREIGMMYKEGRGVEKDIENAKKWLQDAAKYDKVALDELKLIDKQESKMVCSD